VFDEWEADFGRTLMRLRDGGSGQASPWIADINGGGFRRAKELYVKHCRMVMTCGSYIDLPCMIGEPRVWEFAAPA